MRKIVSGIIVECLIGDIALQKDMTAVVNAANAQLRIGGGVAGALHRAAGPGLEEECRPLAPIKPGEAVITGAHNLPNSFVIHCLGPVYGIDKPEDVLLADCYKNSLMLAEDHHIESVAFPAISTGAFGFPLKDATEISFRTIKKMIPKLRHIKHIRFVLHDNTALSVYEQLLGKIIIE
ncbi:MAG: macro domain-containing protein [Candidatus Caldatribacteriota bacterium]|jgi:O-acetyl-ADP-ribose deacetylase (regulator of RNase III)|nr:macro domain-containing protein [Atribacterota bacterium]MDD3640883.1 macro domain-containing protein [Atribacterota bacterium]MDD4288372.1 macro domain-containing protein [Atribacterota bacterium]MDD4764877.1 macro domain-containing protein [Atribacterota bacterium]MDD5635673.1 macro domain-containing protein [Atribacterota bacterium]